MSWSFIDYIFQVVLKVIEFKDALYLCFPYRVFDLINALENRTSNIGTLQCRTHLFVKVGQIFTQAFTSHTHPSTR